MKFKHVITTFALAGLLGAGALVGAKAMQVSESKAATSETTFYIDARNSLWGASNIDNVKAYLSDGTNEQYVYKGDSGVWGTIEVDSVTYVSFSLTKLSFTPTTCMVYCWDFNSEGNKAVTVNFSSFTEGQNLFIVGSSGAWNKNQPVTLGTLSIGTTYEVTKLAVEFDGGVAGEPADWGLGVDEVAGGSAHAVPSAASAYKNLEYFEGWFSNKECTVEYEGTESVNADFTIYAKYTKLAVDSYVYFITEQSENITLDHVYFFGNGYSPADWPGSPLSTYATEVTNNKVLKFNGNEQLIYKIPLPSQGEFNFILNNGSSAKQTYDITTVTRGAGYYAWLEAEQTKYSWSVNVDAGAALDVLLAAEAKRNAVVASEGILDYSVCGISAQDAADLYNAYAALSEGAKGMVDNSFAYTYNGAYDGKTAPGEDYESYAAIMAQLKQIALDGGKVVNGSNSISSYNNDTVVITVVIAVAALISMGGLFLLIKRRKQLD